MGAVAGGVLAYYGTAGSEEHIAAAAVSGVYYGVIGGVGSALGTTGVWWAWSAGAGLVTRLLNGSSCFAAGTQVLMATEIMESEGHPPGRDVVAWAEDRDQNDPQRTRDTAVAVLHERAHCTKNIEDIVPGDLVMAKDVLTGRVGARRVIRTFRNVAYHQRHVEIAGSDGRIQSLTTTDGHPFWVDGEGWVHASRLAGGQYLVQYDGGHSLVLSSVHEAHPGGVAIFNFEVEGLHDYFVSDDSGSRSILVHNSSGPSSEELYRQFQQQQSQQAQQAASNWQQAAATITRTNLQLSQLRQIHEAIENGEIEMGAAMKAEALETLGIYAMQYAHQLEAWEAWLTNHPHN